MYQMATKRLKSKSLYKKKKWSKRKREIKISRYSEYYETVLYELNLPNWKADLHRLAIYKGDMLKIQLDSNSTLYDALESLVKFVRISTTFFDNGLIKKAPEDKCLICEEFNGSLEAIVRRDCNEPFNYNNRSKPGEQVTDTNLFIGDAQIVTGKDIYSPLVKKINEKYYHLTVPMNSIAKWKKGNVKNILGKKVALDPKIITNQVMRFRKVMIRIIDELLKDEEF